MSLYTIKIAEEQYCGPVAMETLMTWARENRISPDFWIWQHTSQTWVQASEIPELLEAIPKRSRKLKVPIAPPPQERPNPAEPALPADPLSRVEAAVDKELEQSRKAAPLGQQQQLRLKSRERPPSPFEERKQTGITQALKKISQSLLPPVLRKHGREPDGE